MKVAVLRETAPRERRVALVPDIVRELVERHGLSVAVEAGAGDGSHHADDAYRAAGAAVGPRDDVLSDADLVLRVAPPSLDEIEALPRDVVLVGLLSPFAHLDVVRALAERGQTAFAMELVPRTTRAQRMDALSSQATVAGYKAVLVGAEKLGRLLPMFMTAAGTVRPGTVLVLGAGVAGLQAIATARRLGARVQAFDVRPAVREQVESLGATFLEAEHEVSAEGEGGYAKELSEEQHRRELELIAEHVKDADIVVTTAQIPGRDAPLLITGEMVRTMKPGSVIVDLASESGGNCELTRKGEAVEAHGVHVLGPLDLPSTIPVHASQMYARNVSSFLLEMVDGGELALDLDNDVVGPACVTHGGRIVHAPTAERAGPPSPPPPTAGSAASGPAEPPERNDG